MVDSGMWGRSCLWSSRVLQERLVAGSPNGLPSEYNANTVFTSSHGLSGFILIYWYTHDETVLCCIQGSWEGWIWTLVQVKNEIMMLSCWKENRLREYFKCLVMCFAQCSVWSHDEGRQYLKAYGDCPRQCCRELAEEVKGEVRRVFLHTNTE